MRRFLFFFSLFLFAPLPEGHSAELRTISVLSYNIKGLPDVVNDGYDQDRYADIGRILRDRLKKGTAPDVVLLQESFVERTKELRELSAYPYVAKGPEANNAFGVDSGLYVLSRYPIVETKTVEFGDACEDWDCLSNKGVQLARIQIPGAPHPIDVYNTHMQAEPEYEETRRKQIQVLKAFVAATHGKRNPLIVAGDFNFRPRWKNSTYFDFLKEIPLVNASEYCRAFSCAMRGSWGQLWRDTVDHHFFEDWNGFFELRPVSLARNFTGLVKGRRLSDHLGFETRYELRWGHRGLGKKATE